MLLSTDQLTLLHQCREILASGFPEFPIVPDDPVTLRMQQVLSETAHRLRDNFPYHHPYYLGQMLRPPHPVALLAYSLAMAINPNNHAHDGGRATSAMELEVVSQLAQMCGWQTHLGHLCSGGTIANFEALWVARELTEGKGIAASSQAHYTHERLSRVLRVPFHAVRCDHAGRMDLAHLEKFLQEKVIGTVVATLGTTGLGATDPLDRLIILREKYPFRLHVDAAYGGYFRLSADLPATTVQAFQALSAADSIVIDPHKHGLQPYGCGCVLFRDRSVAAIYHHESPYTYFTSDDLHLGQISLECSRAGAAAAALWATQQFFPLTASGEFARDLDRCRDAAQKLANWVRGQPSFQLMTEPELDLVVWMVNARTSCESSQLAQRFFDACAAHLIHLALVTLPRAQVEHLQKIQDWTSETVTCLRACVIKPEHQKWMPAIVGSMYLAYCEVFGP